MLFLNFFSKDGIDNLIQIVLACFVATGCIILLFNKKRELKRTRRLDIYHETLNKLDQINQQITIGYSETFIQKQQNFYSAIIQNPDNATDLISDFLREVYGELSRSVKLINKPFTELNSLRLVASKSTLDLLNRYQDASLAQARQFSEILEDFKQGKITGGKIFDEKKPTPPIF